MRMGLPRVITSDQGREFNNHLNKQLMTTLNIKHRLTTAYHPQVGLYKWGLNCFANETFCVMQANGLDERFNQTLQNMLVKYLGEQKEHWELFLDTCLYAYNTSCHESTRYAPFELMFGRKCVLAIDIDMDTSNVEAILDDFHKAKDFSPSKVDRAAAQRQQVLEAAKANIIVAQQKQKEQYDRKHCKPGTVNAR